MHRFFRFRVLTALFLALALVSLSACVVGPPPPPRPALVKRPPRPHFGAVWVVGNWQRRRGHWVWIPGHYR